MSDYRRVYSSGGTYFFTLVTHNRQPIFTTETRVQALRDAMKKIKITRPFAIDAIVILPDHLHCLMRLPESDDDYSGRWREIKKATSRVISPESNDKNERSVWQRRFWEHTIRDEDDWNNHMDYIHYNPVKHGLVRSPREWPWSSFGAMVDKGFYDVGWGAVDVHQRILDMNFE